MILLVEFVGPITGFYTPELTEQVYRTQVSLIVQVLIRDSCTFDLVLVLQHLLNRVAVYQHLNLQSVVQHLVANTVIGEYL